MKKTFTTIGNNITKHTPIFLSIIATIAIAWYLCSTHNMLSMRWSLPIIAGTAGLSALILPALTKRVKPFWSIISTGITLLIMQIFPQILSTSMLGSFWNLSILLFLMAIITEIVANGPKSIHFGGLILDVLISILASWLILNYGNPTLILLVTFITAIVLDFKFSFSLRKFKNSNTTEE